MKQAITLIMVSFCCLATIQAKASVEQENFLKIVQAQSGFYQPTDKSSPSCEEGELVFVSKNSEKGFRIGQKLFFGPFDDTATEVADDSCNIDKVFTFTENSLSQTTKIHRCPASLKAQEVTAVKTITFSKDQIIYEIKDSKVKCVFKKDGGRHE